MPPIIWILGFIVVSAVAGYWLWNVGKGKSTGIKIAVRVVAGFVWFFTASMIYTLVSLFVG